MKKTPSHLRQAIRRLHALWQKQMKAILLERGPLQPGSFMQLRRKCGRANCRCTKGPGHLSYYLSVKDKGRTRMIYVPASRAETVRKPTERYRRFRRHRAMLVKLFAQHLDLIDQLQQALEAQVPQAKRFKSTPRTRPKG